MDGVLAGLVSRGGSDICAKVTSTFYSLSLVQLLIFLQENVFDVYTEVAAYMGWINETILSMGGMQACGLTLEATHDEGWFSTISTIKC